MRILLYSDFSASNGITVATMSYDTQGRRVKKVAADGTHRYFYDGWLLVYEHIVRPNNTTNEIEYVWGKDVSGTRGGAAGIGGLLHLKRDGAIYVPWYDAYGNILGYLDATGNIVAQHSTHTMPLATPSVSQAQWLMCSHIVSLRNTSTQKPASTTTAIATTTPPSCAG